MGFRFHLIEFLTMRVPRYIYCYFNRISAIEEMDHGDDNSWGGCHHSYFDGCHFSCKYLALLCFSVLYIRIDILEAIILGSKKSGIGYKTDVLVLREVSSAYHNLFVNSHTYPNRSDCAIRP